MKHASQIVVPPGGVATCPIELTIKRPGAFESQMELFLEGGTIRKAPLTVTGVGVAAAETKRRLQPQS